MIGTLGDSTESSDECALSLRRISDINFSRTRFEAVEEKNRNGRTISTNKRDLLLTRRIGVPDNSAWADFESTLITNNGD